MTHIRINILIWCPSSLRHGDLGSGGTLWLMVKGAGPAPGPGAAPPDVGPGPARPQAAGPSPLGHEPGALSHEP